MTHKEWLAIPVTWREGDTVTVNGKECIVRYIYTNGFTLVQFPHEATKGGIFNNDSTYPNECVNC